MENRLVIPLEVERKLHAYVMAVNSEIAGMGKVKLGPHGEIADEDGDIILEDVMIYDQEVTGSTADLSSEALAGFMTELIKKGESPRPWIVWWHSHHTMQAFFSGTDTGTIERSTEFDFVISLVVNRKRERKCRIDMHRPFRFTKDDVPIMIGTDGEEVPQDIRDEVRSKVKTKEYKPYGGYQGYNSGKATERRSDWDLRDVPLLSPSERSSTRDLGGNARSLGDIILADDTELDEDEIKAIIEAIDDQIKYFRNAGQADSDECQQLVGERADWQVELIALGAKEAVMGFHDRHGQ